MELARPREVQDNHVFYDHVAKYMEQLGHDKCIAGFMKGCHGPMATVVEKMYDGNDRVIMHDKNHRFKNNLQSLCFTLLPSINHEGIACKRNHLLDWFYWKSEVT